MPIQKAYTAEETSNNQPYLLRKLRYVKLNSVSPQQCRFPEWTYVLLNLRPNAVYTLTTYWNELENKKRK